MTDEQKDVAEREAIMWESQQPPPSPSALGSLGRVYGGRP